MSTRFTRALLRTPGDNYAAGITTSAEGAPVIARALEQHRRYQAALESCGLKTTTLPADPRYPDGTFVEDVAIVTPRGAVITRPGADARRGETEVVAAALAQLGCPSTRVEAPGTVDGGDVCETDDGVLIGITARTNEAGAAQLAARLGDLGLRATTVDIRAVAGLLHLKTGIAYLGDGRLAIQANLPALPAFARYELVRVEPAEGYAANCVRVNDRVLVAAGYPRFADALARLGYDPLPLEMSEFRKMDGGLSCLSLRF
ncbi:MAG: N(G),N(G)-dimethylarginine dimethylaminohydrolase [Proteobacteria bacterium]|nr:N(G),N(G)-dimethylarginine dimethylaminohydrolase [Pseudomonadota bacterium]